MCVGTSWWHASAAILTLGGEEGTSMRANNLRYCLRDALTDLVRSTEFIANAPAVRSQGAAWVSKAPPRRTARAWPEDDFCKRMVEDVRVGQVLNLFATSCFSQCRSSRQDKNESVFLVRWRTWSRCQLRKASFNAHVLSASVAFAQGAPSQTLAPDLARFARSTRACRTIFDEASPNLVVTVPKCVYTWHVMTSARGSDWRCKLCTSGVEASSLSPIPVDQHFGVACRACSWKTWWYVAVMSM